MAYDEATAARLRKLLSARSDVVEKQLMGGLCFMVGGHMCCAVSGRGGLLVRVGRTPIHRCCANHMRPRWKCAGAP